LFDLSGLHYFSTVSAVSIALEFAFTVWFYYISVKIGFFCRTVAIFLKNFQQQLSSHAQNTPE